MAVVQLNNYSAQLPARPPALIRHVCPVGGSGVHCATFLAYRWSKGGMGMGVRLYYCRGVKLLRHPKLNIVTRNRDAVTRSDR